jgi:RNA polymerase sigma factor (sigma-70 family)
VTPVLGQRLRAERAFERLYHRHVGDVYRYSFAILRNPADAEDVTQTTFLNAYRAYRSGERPDSPRAWLIAIAHNVCRQRFRTASRRPQEVAYEDTVAEASVPDPEAPTAEEIQRALGQLAFNQRAALVMRELEGRSYAEIAELLEVSTSAVETLLFRARRALREQLEGSISCAEAEVAISKQLDRKLSRAERGGLRAHLRECAECASLARKQRAQRSAIRSLGVLPLPSSLAAWGGGTAATGTAIGGSVALKAAAVVAAGTVAVGVGREAATRIPEVSDRTEPAVASGEPRPVAARLTLVREASLRAATPAAARSAAKAKESSGKATTAPPAQAASHERAGPKPKTATKSRNARAVAAQTKSKPVTGPAWKRSGATGATKPKPKQKAKTTHAKPQKKRVVPTKPPTAGPKEPKPPSQPNGNGNGNGGGKG